MSGSINTTSSQVLWAIKKDQPDGLVLKYPLARDRSSGLLSCGEVAIGGSY